MRFAFDAGIASWKCLSTGQWDPNGPDLSKCVNWTKAMKQYIQKGMRDHYVVGCKARIAG